MADFIASIDQGTTSTRCMIFNHMGESVSVDQMEHKQIYPEPGRVEHDPLEIWENTQIVVKNSLSRAGLTNKDIAAVGITNQRETSVIWDKFTGKPLYNAIVWQDTRTDKIIRELSMDGQDRFRGKTGLPLMTYFSGSKIKWMIDNCEEVRKAVKEGRALFGNMDTWTVWNLSGGPSGGRHITDVTNASRTMLMDISDLKWAPDMCDVFNIPVEILPEICSSSEIYEYAKKDGPFGGSIPIAGDLGDQHAATVGQTCFNTGEGKNTYGTGCFMILNTGREIVHSENGLLTTVCYKFGKEDTVYALEGSIAIAGALVQWLRDNLNIIGSSSEIEDLAATVEDNGGIYFVPAFSGLFAPYWRMDARGVIAGLTRYANKGHLARACLEATAFQTREVVDAMEADSGVSLKSLKVDGGMVGNEMLMQFQSDLLNVPVIRPKIAETTALGAAYAAGYAIGFWKNLDEMKKNWHEDKSWQPDPDGNAGKELYAQWKKAVTRTFGWVE